MIEALDVMIWGKRVGSLVMTGSGYRKRILFYFDPEFARYGLDVAPLRASLSGALAQGRLPVYPEDDRLFAALPSFIADSLPDAWGNRVFDEWVKANGIRKKDLSVLDILAYIGCRGMGAFEFVPPAADSLETPFKVRIEELAELAAQAMKAAKDFHLTFTPGLQIESLFKVGTSAGGRRPKAVVNMNMETAECYSGQVAAPVPGFTPVIIKFDEHTDVPTTRIEYSYYLMAHAAGLRMMPSRLLEIGEDCHFLTERFDRVGERKLHVQTLAAMSSHASSYEEWFDVGVRLGFGPEEKRQMFLQMVMNLLSGNVDDHSKNFAFIMDEGGRWRLAPAYDFTFTVDPSAPFYVNRHSMTVNGGNEGVTYDDVMEIARRFSIKSPDAIIRKAIDTVARYPLHASEAAVPAPWISRIESEIAARLAAFRW